MLRFLSANEYLETIQGLIENSQHIDIAVAFWGRGARSRLRLRPDQDVRIVCSLRDGLSNPAAVRSLRLIYGKDRVKQYGHLHAKVFLFDNATAVVGSANVSIAGLPATEAEQSAGWMEAGVLLDDPATVQSIGQWYDSHIWQNAQRITQDDLTRAWLHRQLFRQLLLFDTLEQNPAFFRTEDNWRMVIYDEPELSPGVWDMMLSEAERDGIVIDGVYERWRDIEAVMHIMDFYVHRGKENFKVAYQGIYEVITEHQNYGEPSNFGAISQHIFNKDVENRYREERWTRFINFILARNNLVDHGLVLTIREVRELLGQYLAQTDNP
jgi:hypothetical protein